MAYSSCGLNLDSNIIAVLIFIAVFLFLYLSTRKPKGIPPGPSFTLPIIGDLLLFFGVNIRNTFSQLQQKHGNVFSFYLGKDLTVVINGYDLIHKAAVKNGNVFSDRPSDLLNNFIAKGKGVIMSKGRFWKEQRKFTHTSLQEFGFGKTSIEEQIIKEVECFVKVLKEQDGKPYDFKECIHASVFNVLCSMLIAKRFEYDDKVYQHMLHMLDENMKIAMPVSVALSCLPFLQYLPGDPLKVSKMLSNMHEMKSFFNDFYEQHNKTIDLNNPRDFMDIYISEIIKEAASSSSSDYNVEQLLFILIDLFAAGAETTATAIRWAVVYILNFPDIKLRLQAEIDDVIPNGGLPTLDDKAKLPYVEAFIMETLRFANIVPLAVPHAVVDDRDIEFEGYRIPKGTSVIFNLDSVLFDPAKFNNPMEFSPDRFLDGNGEVVRQKEWISFGIGRRVCLGELVAKMELFLYLTTLLKNFDFLLPEGSSPPSTEGELGIAYAPFSFEVRAVERLPFKPGSVEN